MLTQDTSAQSGPRPRPPIVVVMGHVDHGKTTLLDFLRKSRVAEREAGGITQSIGAYEVERNGKRITFIDTPGHQAFTHMRQRGAQVADVAILVVAADDGVQPQTEEAISILQNSGTPFVVAITKIDKNNADIEKTKQDLLAHGVYLEGFGGEVPWHGISSKTGEGVDELLDLVLLLEEMSGSTCNPAAPAKGFVLESKVDSRRGIIAVVIVKEGTLRVGSTIATSSACGKIKILEDFTGKRVDELTPCAPALVVGFEQLPAIGEEYTAGELEIEAYRNALVKKEDAHTLPMQQNNEAAAEDVISVFVKADVSGSLEALAQVIASMTTDGATFRVLGQGVGDISDSDIKDAKAMNAIIAGFNVKLAKSAENLARAHEIKIITSNIIYRIVEALEDIAKNRDRKEILGKLEVLALFSKKDKKQLIGGRVTEGILTLNQKFHIVRGDESLGMGRITNLQMGKKPATKVENCECGLMIESPIDIAVGDILVVEK
ncbi:MAG: translation initiation factor IF-2 [Candidatus Pacebacteria bacterium]|nr:translation initiation factor IF-2 [Candidatus Paceibacterota bacterium]